jgi:hypothetical protein
MSCSDADLLEFMGACSWLYEAAVLCSQRDDGDATAAARWLSRMRSGVQVEVHSRGMGGVPPMGTHGLPAGQVASRDVAFALHGKPLAH